jgi:pimeloyl-ACP methyl ester carboxylesterase
MVTHSLSANKSTNDRSFFDAYWHRFIETMRPARPAERAALDFVTPPREVSPPMLPLPVKGARPLAVPNWRSHLNAWQVGEADAPAILLLHGWGGDMRDLDPFVAPLAAHGFRVIAADLPGHGRSAGETSHVVEFAQAARAIADAAGPLYGVIGHSLGAAAAIVALADGLSAGRAVLVAAAADLGLYVRGAAKAHHLDEAETEEMVCHLRVMTGRPLSSLDLASLATRLSVPALFVHSSDDRMAPIGAMRSVAMRWKSARILVQQGLGHRKLLGDPAVIGAAVEFLVTSRANASVDGAPGQPLGWARTA